MSGPKRYDVFNHIEFGAIMVGHSEGGWVKWEDYSEQVRHKKNAEQIANQSLDVERQAAREALKAACSRCAERFPYSYGPDLQGAIMGDL
jgi:hypothetical protein